MNEVVTKMLLTWLSIWLIVAAVGLQSNTLLIVASLATLSAFISSAIGRQKKLGSSGSFLMGYCFSVLGLIVVIAYPKSEAGWNIPKTILITFVLFIGLCAVLYLFGNLAVIK